MDVGGTGGVGKMGRETDEGAIGDAQIGLNVHGEMGMGRKEGGECWKGTTK